MPFGMCWYCAILKKNLQADEKTRENFIEVILSLSAFFIDTLFNSFFKIKDPQHGYLTISNIPNFVKRPQKGNNVSAPTAAKTLLSLHY